MFSTNNPHQKTRRKELRNNMTPAEKILWKHIRGKQILEIKFRRQFGVGPYILDFYSHEKRLCIEIDGETHENEKAKIKDQKRTAFLESQGITVIRYTNFEIYENLEGVLEDLIQKIQDTPPSLP